VIFKRLVVFSILVACVFSMLGAPVSMATTNYKICNGNTQCNNSDGCDLLGFGTHYTYWIWMGTCIAGGGEDSTCAMSNRVCYHVVTYAFESCSGAVLSDVNTYQSGCR